MCQDTRARIQCIGSKPLSSTYLFFSVHFALWCWIYPALSIGNGVWLGTNQLRNGFFFFFCYLLLFNLFFLRVFMFAIHVCWFDIFDRFNGLLSPALHFLFYYFPISLTSSRVVCMLFWWITLHIQLHLALLTWTVHSIPCIMHNSVHVMSRFLFLLFTVFLSLGRLSIFCCFEKKKKKDTVGIQVPASMRHAAKYSRWNEYQSFSSFQICCSGSVHSKGKPYLLYGIEYPAGMAYCKTSCM